MKRHFLDRSQVSWDLIRDLVQKGADHPGRGANRHAWAAILRCYFPSCMQDLPECPKVVLCDTASKNSMQDLDGLPAELSQKDEQSTDLTCPKILKYLLASPCLLPEQSTA